MTDLGLLENKIGELQAHLNEAWRDLSSSSLTSFERRELRNEMKRCGAELQRCLDLVRSEYSRSLRRPPEDRGNNVRAVDFRLIGQSGNEGSLPVLPRVVTDTHR